jgi:hypothetical protein
MQNRDTPSADRSYIPEKGFIEEIVPAKLPFIRLETAMSQRFKSQ